MIGSRQYTKLVTLFSSLLVLHFVLGTNVKGHDRVQVSKERASLLSFMAGIVADPDNVLENWKSSNSHVCNWTGVTCNRAKDRVIQLDLNERSLRGTISPALSNLTFLVVLDLSGNCFHGRIPAELGALSYLKELSFESNLLEGNIPVEFGFLHRLVYLNLGTNRLLGQIPATLLCNSSSLQYIDLSNNSLSGEIPIGSQYKLDDLKYLLLWSNQLVGQIPPALSNSSKLKWIDMESNSLTGPLPAEIVDKVPHLQFLYLSYNNLESHDGNTNLSHFFTSLVHCHHLQELELAGNNLGGEIPSAVGNLSASLVQLHLEENLIHGSIPPSIANLANLTLLNLSSNLLTGPIPSEVGRMAKLERVYLSSNFLSSEIPPAFGHIPHLGLLDLSKNMLSGSIPDTVSNLAQLRRLLLYENNLSGTIPPSLGNCVNLEILDLSYNSLTGLIPNEVAGLRSLKLYFNLSSNLLEGPLPLELSKMDMVLAIDLSSNSLSGPIPPQIGSCIALEYLNLSNNLLQGPLPLPLSIDNLLYLQALDLSFNRLTGEIPKTLQASSTLKQLNLSFNNFSGMVNNDGAFKSITADSFIGNDGLCGSISGMPTCQTKRTHRSVILPILLALLGTPCLVCLCGYRQSKSRKRRLFATFHGSISEEDDDQDGNQPKFPRISYQQLLEATAGFDDSSLIGSGMFGHVYKGTLQDNTRIAVKVLDSRRGGEILGSFKRECQVLKRTRHRNLIKMITVCSRPDFKALVLPLMSNGSLESHLYPTCGTGPTLNLIQLVNICSDITEGMAYLHHHSPAQVVHCDLKPSNILLDDDMTALVSDFGIARLVKGSSDESDGSSCNSTTGLLCGSVGYIAPEYAMGRQASTQGDVYSFGVLLLEIVTGRRPTDVIFQAGSSMHDWVKSRYPYKLEPIIEDALKRLTSSESMTFSREVLGEVIGELIDLGLICTQLSASSRPTMIDMVHEMGHLKHYLSRDATLTIEAPSGTDSSFRR